MDVSAQAILSVIAAEARLDASRLRPDATLVDLDIGSIDLVSIVFELEDRFGVEIQPEDISPTATIAELIDHVLSRQPQ
jgi:acyl carrier protein